MNRVDNPRLFRRALFAGMAGVLTATGSPAYAETQGTAATTAASEYCIKSITDPITDESTTKTLAAQLCREGILWQSVTATLEKDTFWGWRAQTSTTVTRGTYDPELLTAGATAEVNCTKDKDSETTWRGKITAFVNEPSGNLAKVEFHSGEVTNNCNT